MLVIVQWSLEALHHRPSLRILATTAAQHEVVVVCSHHAAGGGVVSGLREALPRCQIVALLADGDVPGHERELIDDLINDGKLPLIFTTGDPARPGLTDWLKADARIELPDGAEVATALLDQREAEPKVNHR
jgi:hypothetical protein